MEHFTHQTAKSILAKSKKADDDYWSSLNQDKATNYGDGAVSETDEGNESSFESGIENKEDRKGKQKATADDILSPSESEVEEELEFEEEDAGTEMEEDDDDQNDGLDQILNATKKQDELDRRNKSSGGESSRQA